MPLFDRYIAVDWSAANSPKRGKDSIWIGELGRDGRVPSENPSTRHDAMASIASRLLAARQRRQRIMLGLDFVFGYPRGAAAAIGRATGLSDTSPLAGEDGWGGDEPRWLQLWSTLHRLVVDAPDNRSNRFQIAESLNLRLADGPHFWGHPHQHSYPGLTPRRPATAYARWRAR
jgi:precorrin-8X/cobalt-precorrin-8 methylmutase